MEKVSKTTARMIPTSVPKSIKINAESMLEKVMQKTFKIIIHGTQNGTQHHQTSIKNKIKHMMEKHRLRPVWYGGPLRPKNTSDLKDNSSEDNLPHEKMKFRYG